MFSKSLRGIGTGLYNLADKWENREPLSYYGWIKVLFGIFLAFPTVGAVGIVRGYLISDILIVCFGIFILTSGTACATYFYNTVLVSERERDLSERRQSHPTYSAITLPEI